MPFSGTAARSLRDTTMSSEQKQNTWTSDALQRGDSDAIRSRVLEEPGYLSERDYVNDTPLLNAIDFDDLELVRFLLVQGADPNVEVDDGYTCLLSAIESEADKSVAIVQTLIDAGADIHFPGTNGWTPLHMAAARGRVEIAAALIKAGAVVDCRKEIDAEETPLMEAAEAGHPEAVRLLLSHGADPSLRDTIHCRTALEWAQDARKGADPGVVEFLKNEHFDLDDEDLEGFEHADKLKKMVQGIDMTQMYIDSANSLAEKGNHEEVIRILEPYRGKRFLSRIPKLFQRFLR